MELDLTKPSLAWESKRARERTREASTEVLSEEKAKLCRRLSTRTSEAKFAELRHFFDQFFSPSSFVVRGFQLIPPDKERFQFFLRGEVASLSLSLPLSLLLSC